MAPSEQKRSIFLNKDITMQLKPVALRLVFLGAVAATGAYYLSPRRAEKAQISQLSTDNQEIFKKFSANMKVADYYVENQAGLYEEVKQFMAESTEGKQAKTYAENLVEEARKGVTDKKYETLESKIELAKNVIANAREFMQKTEAGGNGYYTLGYEHSEKREQLKKEVREGTLPEEKKQQLIEQLNDSQFDNSNSYQKFDEFYSPKDSTILAGDCDDFSIALTTTYHAVKDYASSKKETDGFYKALYEGLDHYKVFSVEINSHALNLAAVIKAAIEFELIEPQDMSIKFELGFSEGKAYIKNYKGDEKTITKLYNREFSAVEKQEWDK